MPRSTTAPPVLVEVRRGGRVESRHRGDIAVVAPDGTVVASVGDPDRITYLRSSAKPFQLAPFVASGRFDGYGFGNPTEALAIMAASHSGEDRHVRTVQALLRQGGLSRDVLQCGTHPPFDVETAQRLLRDGEPLTALRHNCSGKHIGFILHAKAAGWDLGTYWHPDHPTQQLALETVSALTDVPAAKIATATDGCGVVSFGVPLRAAALAFVRLADPSGVTDVALRTALERIRDAMIAHPELVGGERRRLDTDLMRAAPRTIVAKAGAEGVQCLGVLAPPTARRASPAKRDRSAEAAAVNGGLRRGPLGFALKIEDGDGARRAVSAATCAALGQLGVLDAAALERLADFASPSILDPRGEPAGEVVATFGLS